MQKLLRLIGCVLALSSLDEGAGRSIVYARQPGTTEIVARGKTILFQTLGKKRLEITLQTTTIESTSKSFPLNAASGITEVRVIRQLEVSIDGKPLDVTNGVYADLIDPSKASLKIDKGLFLSEFVLSISGGEVENSYTVDLPFNTKAMSVRRRAVRGNLFPASLATEKGIFIQAVDGRNGKPISNEHLLVSVGATGFTRTGKYKIVNLFSDAKGRAFLSLADAPAAWISVSVDWHSACGDEKTWDAIYRIDDIKKSGLKTPNDCGSAKWDVSPNEFTVFARPMTLWEKIQM